LYVDLISDKELEFVDTDMETMLAAQALGFDTHGPELEFYNTYTSSGFEPLVGRMAKAIYDALEEQGYEAFNHGDFTSHDYAKILLRNLDSSGVTDASQKIAILESYVDLFRGGRWRHHPAAVRPGPPVRIEAQHHPRHQLYRGARSFRRQERRRPGGSSNRTTTSRRW